MKKSAGLIPYRLNKNKEIEFFVGHPGGKYWKNKNYWSFLKGGIEGDESILSASLREFEEESGIILRTEDNILRFLYLGEIKQNKNKLVYAFAIEYPDINPDICYSNMADNGLNYEIDNYDWKTFEELKECTHKKHIPFYKKIIELVTNENNKE